MTFKDDKYCVVRNVCDTKDLWKHIKSIMSEGDANDTQVIGSPSFYKDVEVCKMQIKLMPLIEKTTGLKLYPTYTYNRIYVPGAILETHTDRPACEISITLCVGYDGDYNWPIWITDPITKDSTAYMLEPGDMAIYRGCEVEHYREKYTGVLHGAVFLHYVDQEGPYRDCIYDIKEVIV